jgi:hypothetical protein
MRDVIDLNASAHIQRCRLSQFFYSAPNGSSQGFGMCMVLLTIRQPWMMNITTTGWNSSTLPLNKVPYGTSSKIQPFETQNAMIMSRPIVVGIGVPSKYFDLPLASLGKADTVTLKRARRTRPQRTKKERKRWSRGVRTPMAKAQTAGATPKDICRECQFLGDLAEANTIPQEGCQNNVPGQPENLVPDPSCSTSVSTVQPCHPGSRRTCPKA